MSDLSWRDIERRTLLDPTDQDALERAIASRRRAGMGVPARLLDRRVQPARSFVTRLPCRVWAQLPGWKRVEVQASAAPGGWIYEIPPCCAWWVEPRDVPASAQPSDPPPLWLDDVVQYLRGTGVQGLTIRDALDERQVERLARLESIRRLDIRGGLSDGALGRLVDRFPGLVELRLGRCERLTARGAEHLQRLTELSRLKLSGGELLDDEGMAAIGGLRGLVELDLSGCKDVTDRGLERLAPLTELVTLAIRHSAKLTEAGMVKLSGMSELVRLDLSWCQRISDGGLLHLARLPRLRALELHGCNRLTDAGLAHVTGLDRLSVLSLGPSVRGITDDGLLHLAGLANLTRLNLQWCEEISDRGLLHITPLQSLTHLDLLGCIAVTDEGLQYLLRLPNLARLNVWRCEGITDVGLAALRQKPSLRLDVAGDVSEIIAPRDL